jgi:hypothetical protein
VRCWFSRAIPTSSRRTTPCLSTTSPAWSCMAKPRRSSTFG